MASKLGCPLRLLPPPPTAPGSGLNYVHLIHLPEKAMALHSSALAWRIPGTAEPGGLLSMESHRVGHDWPDLAATAYPLTVTSTKTHWQTNSASIHFSSLMWRLPLSPSHLKGVFWVEMPWSEVKSLSHVWLSVTPWTVAYQAHLSMRLQRVRHNSVMNSKNHIYQPFPLLLL